MKIIISKNEYDDMAKCEARKYVEKKQNYAEMIRRVNRYTQEEAQA